MNFIKLTRIDGKEMWVNLARVEIISQLENSDSTQLFFPDYSRGEESNYVLVKETPEQILSGGSS